MIRPFGESALLVELDGPLAAQRLDADLRADPIDGILGSVPGLSSLLVELDPSTERAAIVEATLAARVEHLDSATPATGRQRVIPVVYGGEHGPDLPEVASLAGMTEDDVVARHARLELRALFGGFAPGFVYLGDLPPDLRIGRLATPRTRTAAGSVAIAAALTGIYPATLPGGWRVIGRTPITLFDPRRDPPAYLVAGDTVRFERIPAAAWDDRAGLPADW